jgi:hypothetical protein
MLKNAEALMCYDPAAYFSEDQAVLYRMSYCSYPCLLYLTIFGIIKASFLGKELEKV